MSDYPEHDKLSAIKDESHAIGSFIDHGLPKMHMAIYQRVIRDCECQHCEAGHGDRSRWHTEDELATIVDGKVQITAWYPTHRSIERILAEYFDIDLDKIDDEKRAMLAAMRTANASAS